MGLLLLLNFRSATRPFEVISTSGARRSLGNGDRYELPRWWPNSRIFLDFFYPENWGKIRSHFGLSCHQLFQPNRNLDLFFRLSFAFYHGEYPHFPVFQKCPFSSFSPRGELSSSQHLEPQATIYKWMFQLDDEPNLYIQKWLEITELPSISKWLALGFQV